MQESSGPKTEHWGTPSSPKPPML